MAPPTSTAPLKGPPKGPQRYPKGTQGCTKGAQGAPKGAQGRPRAPKGRPQDGPKVIWKGNFQCFLTILNGSMDIVAGGSPPPPLLDGPKSGPPYPPQTPPIPNNPLPN